MKKVTFIIVLLAAVRYGAYAQNFAWAKNYGGDGNVSIFQILYDDSGNIYTAGNLSGTFDFDPGPGTYNLTSSGGPNVVIQKLTSEGNFVWAKNIDRATWATGYGSAEGLSFALSKEGNILLGGAFMGTIDFDPGAGTFELTSRFDNAFLLKLDNSGNFIAAEQFTTSYAANSIITSLAFDENDNLICAGRFEGTMHIDSSGSTVSLTSAGDYNIFFLKLNDSGNFVWVKQIDGDDAGVSSLASDHFGNVYSTGYFYHWCDFDPGPAVHELSVGSPYVNDFIVKLDSSGNYVWAKQFYTPYGLCQGQLLKVDAQCNVYSAGFFLGSCDFDPDGAYYLSCDSTVNVFISKLDSGGHFVWAKQLGDSVASISPGGLGLDTLNNIYLAGIFRGTINFNPGAGPYNMTAPAGNSNIFAARFDSLGNFGWAVSIGGSSTDGVGALDISRSGTIYLAGGFGGMIDFDPGYGTFNMTALSWPGSSCFVEKLNQCLFSSPVVNITVSPGVTISAGQPDTFVAHCFLGGLSPLYQWYINSIAIAGATNATYITNTIMEGDSVTCRLTSSDTCATVPVCNSNSLVIHVLESVQETSDLQHLSLFPNPNTGTFFVTANGLSVDGTADIVVTNVLGQQVYRGISPVRNGQINATVQLNSTLPLGIYFLKASFGQGSSVIRFSVEK